MSKSPGCQRTSPSIDINIGIGLSINPRLGGDAIGILTLPHRLTKV